MKTKIKSVFANIALMAITIALAIVLGSQAPQLYKKWQGNSRSGDFTLHVVNQPYRLTLYGTSTCPHCAKAREYLKAAGISFNDRIVDKSNAARDMFSKLNENSVPVLVSKNRLIIGFNENEYDELAKVSRD